MTYIKGILLFFLLSFVFLDARSADVKRALKLLEKGEYDKLSELLDKSIKKDSINAGAKYIYSLLFLTSDYKKYNIDTSYYYIVRAQKDLALEDEKELQQLNKLNINDSTIILQKATVEKQAFVRAKNEHTIASYNYFLDHFPEAAQRKKAIALRNKIAYDDAVKANTYQAFLDFLNTYPDADEVPTAREHYEKLLYQTKTKDKKLDSYRQFLMDYPETVYRYEAEKNIFEISCADNRIESYLTFIRTYPKSRMNRQAWNFIYHKIKAMGSAGDFIKQFDKERGLDSLKHMAAVDHGYLIAIYEMGKYGFINEKGHKLIDFTYTDVNEDYLCGNIREDYLEVWDNMAHLLVSRLGAPFYKGSFESVKDLGCGLLRLEKNGRFGVLHKSGSIVTDFDFEDAKLIDLSFIAFKYKGRWGLKSFTGRDILPPEYEDILADGKFVLVKNKNLFAVQNVENLAAAADLRRPQLAFSFDDYETINDTTLLLFNGIEETVVGLDLKQQIPIGNQQFFEFHNGWIVKKGGKYHLYNRNFKPLSGKAFDRVEIKHTKTALRLGKKWAIYNENRTFPTTFPYDSVRFLSERIGILMEGKKTYAMFGYDTLMDISSAEKIRLISDQSLEIGEDGRGQYLLTKTSKGSYKVYNVWGKLILNGRYSAIEALGKEYILIEKSGKKGLIYENGDVALKLRYKAISNYDHGYVSTFLNGKFGICNYKKKVFLSAKYSKTLKPYGNSYFIGAKNNKLAFIDLDNKNISGFDFEKVLYWNDTSALVRSGEDWFIFDIRSGAKHAEGILEFKYLRNDQTEIILLITGKDGNGVISNRHGVVIAPTFNDIVNIGSKENPVYFAEKFIREALFYVVIYYDSTGKILRKQVFNEEEYNSIYCG